MSVTAFLDANVLYPVTLRSVLMYLANAELFRALWSDAVNGEWMAALARDRPDLPASAIARVRDLMEAHVEHAVVSGYEGLIPTLVLPDPDDRHVLAAAIHGGASVIVTANLKDFPAETRHPTTWQHRSRMPSFAISSWQPRIQLLRHSLQTARDCAIRP